ncbi:MAG: hypothetical protein KatS3mg049_2410 [Caldilinea sp.]|nr:MAG: hypothetical protein KatS3mg049_2410 [Caldilinea sp.]
MSGAREQIFLFYRNIFTTKKLTAEMSSPYGQGCSGGAPVRLGIPAVSIPAVKRLFGSRFSHFRRGLRSDEQG